MALMPPNSPQSNYDFILKDQSPPKGRFHFGLSLPGSNVSAIALISLILVVGILFSVLIFGRSGSANSPLVDLVARAQEINRVSALASSQSNVDTGTKDSAATVQAILSSQQQQLVTYLGSVGTKIVAANETTYQNSNTDKQLAQASQNGNLTSFYQNYLKANLATYQSAIQTDYKTAASGVKTQLAADYSSVGTILSSL